MPQEEALISINRVEFDAQNLAVLARLTRHVTYRKENEYS